MIDKINLIVIDVDGTLTDAGIYYDNNGNELKKFCTKDAAGFFAAHQVGIKIMVLTGRESAATTRRMKELKVDYLFQNVCNKRAFLQKYIMDNNIQKEEIAYIGDDINDLSSMQLAGYVGCPADGCLEIKNMADYVCPTKGGHGAVRDFIEHILRETGQWKKVIACIYK